MKRGANELKQAKAAEKRPSFDVVGDVSLVNGAVMEGGGQILRNCVALAAILEKKLNIFAIRANRPRGGGLRPQHLQGIDLVASLCEAKTKGFEVGSCEIDFAPGKMRPDVSNATADTKTAGSICLLCQVAVPVCVFGAAPRMTLTLRGGTNATQAPPIDYFVHALLPLLHRMGVNCAAKITKRGFFPKGGGEVQVMVEKVEGSLKPIRLLSQGDVVKVTAHAFHTAGLRGDTGVSKYEEQLRQHFGPNVEIVWDIDEVKNANDRASGVTFLAETTTGCLFGFSMLGEAKTGSPLSSLFNDGIAGLAKNVGKDKFVCVDEFMQDQLLIFMALANGMSEICTGPLTLHTCTAIFFVSQLTGAKFQVIRTDSGKDQTVNVEDGIDYENKFPDSRFRIVCNGIGLKR